MRYNEKLISYYKEKYPKGTRICLDSMENDPQPIQSGAMGTVGSTSMMGTTSSTAIQSGAMGTVVAVDDAGNLLMKWDNGRSLSLIPGEDSFHKIQEEVQTEDIDVELSEEPNMNMTM